MPKISPIWSEVRPWNAFMPIKFGYMLIPPFGVVGISPTCDYSLSAERQLVKIFFEIC